VIVRFASPADAAALAALALKTFDDAFMPFNREEDMIAYTKDAFTEAQQLREIEDPKIVTLVVEEADGALAAYAQVRPTPGAPHGEVELARFYVDQAHHGRGIAQSLMAAVDAEARRLGAHRIWLGVWERNHRAIRFYRKCGFEQCGTHVFILGTDVQTDWDMVRRIAE
jgi:ribosomal protein S18 acetylase RimI-like enzyme